jgi:hypothetical protein
MRMRCVMLPPVVCHAVTDNSTLSHKLHNFLKYVTKHKMSASIFFTNFVQNIHHSKKNLAIYYHKCS